MGVRTYSSADRHNDAACWEHQSVHLCYQVKVRNSATNTPIFLWGSAGIVAPISFPTPPLLHMRNDELGQPISIGVANGEDSIQPPIGILQPGECLSMPIQNISGVYASYPTSANPTAITTLSCFIKTS